MSDTTKNAIAESKIGKIGGQNSSNIKDKSLLTRAADKLDSGYDSFMETIGYDQDYYPTGAANAKSIINLTSDPLSYGMPEEGSFQSVNAAKTGQFYQIRSMEVLSPVEGSSKKHADQLLTTEGIRRPLLGLAEKENSVASMRVEKITGNEETLKLYDSLKETGNVRDTSPTSTTFNFFVRSISQSYTEKSQIIETFGKTYFFFFGQNPTTVSIQGSLLNAKNFNWRNDFLKNYLEVLRGSQAAKVGGKLSLIFDDIIIKGYVMDFNLIEGNTRMRELSNFSMSLVATDIQVYESYDYSGYESSPPDYITQEYFEYMGPYGTATKEGSTREDKTIYLYTSFSDVLSKYIGFNLRSVSRIENLVDTLGSGDWKSQKAYGLAQWSTWANQSGANVFEFDRILNTKAGYSK